MFGICLGLGSAVWYFVVSVDSLVLFVCCGGFCCLQFGLGCFVFLICVFGGVDVCFVCVVYLCGLICLVFLLVRSLCLFAWYLFCCA